MSQQVVIDSLAFARDTRRLEGDLAMADMPRVHDLLTEVSGSVHYRLTGRIGALGKSQLLLQLDGFVPLRCQRCMERLDFSLHVESVLELVGSEADLTQEDLEDDSRDFLPAEKKLDVLALIEDEVILALPVVPRHDSCSLPGGGEKSVKESPFAVLAGLKGKA